MVAKVLTDLAIYKN